MPRPSQGVGVDANELASRVAQHMLSEEGTGPAWGITIEEARAGYARLSMLVRPDMLNGHGTVHGGMVFALADTAFAYVCNGRNQKTVAAQASIIFLGSAEAGEEDDRSLGGDGLLIPPVAHVREGRVGKRKHHPAVNSPVAVEHVGTNQHRQARITGAR